MNYKTIDSLGLSLLLLGILGGSLTSCTQRDEAVSFAEADANNAPQQLVGIELSATMQDIAAQEEAEGESARAVSYNLSGKYRFPKISFGAVGASAQDVPIHLFFRNTKDNQTHYITLTMSKVKAVASGSQRDLLFSDFRKIDMKGKLTAANADHWYVKGFLGGYAENPTAPRYPSHNQDVLNNGTANQIRLLMDALPVVNDDTNTLVMPANFISADKLNWGMRPFPQETKWTKFNFSHLPNGNPNPRYVAGKQMLSFMPVGALLRIRLENKGKMPISFNSFAMHELETEEVTGADGNVTSSRVILSPDPIYLNEVIYAFDRPLRVNASGVVDEQASRTFRAGRNNSLLYRFPGDARGVSRLVSVDPGRACIVYAWIHENELNKHENEPNKSVSAMTLTPTFYQNMAPASSNPDLWNYMGAESTEQLAAPQRKVLRTSFVSGKSYPIGITVYSKEDVRLEGSLTFDDYINDGLLVVRRRGT